jgi:hypothetical protein
MTGAEEEVMRIADLVRRTPDEMTCFYPDSSPLEQIQKGASNARSDDTKSLKSAILDWIMPRGQPLNPPLMRNVKTDRGFHHERTGALLCPAGLDWSDPSCVSYYIHLYLTIADHTV